MRDFVCFMYHEFEVPGRIPCRSNPGYMRYVVTAGCFAQQLAALQDSGWKGCSITEAVRGMERAVAITIDDCTSADLELAAPMLREAGFRATFYCVASWIDTANHLTIRDLRRLVDMGLEVGSHSLTHSYLPGMPQREMRRELAESKNFLEQVTGKPVEHFSCPFGGYGPALLDTAMEVGYRTVATSRIGHNRPGAIVLNRIAVRRNTRLSTFARMCDGGGLVIPLIRQALLAPLKRVARFQGYSR